MFDERPNSVPDPPSLRPLVPGQIVDGRYEILSFSARGGMGALYLVRQVFFDKELLLKTLDAAVVSDTAVQRFQREARTVSSLNHPNIVRVFDFGTIGLEIPYFTMELLQGENLAQRLKRLGVLSVNDSIDVVAQVCLGLAHAHRSGVIHRDIKPSNIMLIDGVESGKEGSVKILDFGIARLATDERLEAQALTKTGEIFGSPMYMSPEQCAGSQVDYRSDIYSLGCVLFELLTGAPPFFSENVLSTMVKHQNETAVTLAQGSFGLTFPSELETLVAKMLAKLPSERYQDLGAVAIDLSLIRKREANILLPENAERRQLLSDILLKTMVRHRFALISSFSAIICIGAYLIQNSEVQKARKAASAHEDVSKSPLRSSPASNSAKFDKLESIFQREHRALDAYERSTEKSWLIDAGTIHLLLPPEPIGVISNSTDIWTTNLDSTWSKDAVGHVSLPRHASLSLTLGGKTDAVIFAYPNLLTKVPNFLFRQVTIKGPLSVPESEESLSTLLDTLSTWTHLENLELNDMFLSSKAFVSLKKLKRITNLKFAKLRFTHEMHHVPQIDSVSCFGSDNDADLMALLAMEMPKLSVLGLGGQNTANGALARLVRCKSLSLRTLNLSEWFFDENTIADLAKLKSLETLSFARTELSQKQVEHLLKSCQNLKKVTINRTSREQSFVSGDTRLILN